MAVDTAAKRFSMMRLTGAGSLFPPQTSGLSDAEKAASLGLYVGIDLNAGILILTFDADVVVWTDLTYDTIISSNLDYNSTISSNFVFDVGVV